MNVHARLPKSGELKRPPKTAAELGYRMPGEFEPIDAVWLAYPTEPTTWPGCFDKACEQYNFFMSQVARFARVELVNTKHGWPTNDSWIRDYGPIFVRNDRGDLACHDFVFNGWGGKYDGDVRYADDDVVPQRAAHMLDIPIWIHDFVLEGGSVEPNGVGTLLTTEQCLLAESRNPDRARSQIEQKLRDTLGVTDIVWLPGGIAGDDTDGHIDDLARFVSPDTVAAIRAPKDHPDHDVLERNWTVLESTGFDLVELPVPEPLFYDYPADAWGEAERRITPASYANFLIVNEAVLVPVFGRSTDDPACRAIESALPGRMIIPIPAASLVVGLGALHCLSQHQPAAPTNNGDTAGASPSSVS